MAAADESNPWPTITSAPVEAAGLRFGVLENSAEAGECAALLIHGNLSSSEFMRELLVSLEAKGVFGAAIDLRGYGSTESATEGEDLPPIAAASGLGDWASEAQAAADAIAARKGSRIKRWVWLGWSLGGGVVMARILSVQNGNTDVAGALLAAPVSPSGFGGSKGTSAFELIHEDGAGSGGGLVNPAFVASVVAKDRGDGPTSARATVKGLYVAPSFVTSISDRRMDAFVDSVLATRTGDGFWPGAAATSPNWPGVRPGDAGINNAISATHAGYLWGLADLHAAARVPVTWVRGDSDAIVADGGPLDIATLGAAGAVPGYPGEEAFPPQAMVSQTRELLLERYGKGDCGRAAGRVKEVVLEGVGHGVVIEAPERVASEIVALME